jgi:hypothetical protein
MDQEKKKIGIYLSVCLSVAKTWNFKRCEEIHPYAQKNLGRKFFSVMARD